MATNDTIIQLLSIFFIFALQHWNTTRHWSHQNIPLIFTKAVPLLKLQYIKTPEITSSKTYIDGLVQDCVTPMADALDLLQSCTKPSISFHTARIMHYLSCECSSLIQWHYCSIMVNVVAPGPRLNIKTVLSTYGDFHVKDKTAVRTSYL